MEGVLAPEETALGNHWADLAFVADISFHLQSFPPRHLNSVLWTVREDKISEDSAGGDGNLHPGLWHRGHRWGKTAVNVAQHKITSTLNIRLFLTTFCNSIVTQLCGSEV